MKYEFLKRGAILFFAINLFFLLVIEGQTQSLFPKFATLTVSFWPEYDRAEVLVIYRAQLKAETVLPTQVSFRLPGYVEDLHAVAVEQEGRLIEVSPDTIELQPEGDAVWLTFPTSSLNVHFEYYDPVILTQQEQARQLIFAFTPPYALENVIFEFQHPVTAEGFVFMPEAVSQFTGNDALLYSTIPVANLAAEETFELSVSYRRNTNTFSQQILANNTGGQPLTAIETVTSPGGERFNLGYLLLGGGIVVLLGVGGYWWMKQAKAKSWADRKHTRRRTPRPNRSINTRKKGPAPQPNAVRERSAKASPVMQPSAATPLTFCYKCGQALYDGASFCHACGTKRRTTKGIPEK